MSDIRKQKTLRNIDQAIYELLGQMSFTKISVKKICDHAELGRSTFYQYYFDKYDWLEKQVAHYDDRLSEALEKRFAHHSLSQVLDDLMNYLWDDHQKLSLLFEVHTPEADLTEAFRKLLMQYFAANVSATQFDKDEYNYLTNLYGSVAVNNIKWSMQHGISNKVNRLMDHALKEIVNNYRKL